MFILTSPKVARSSVKHNLHTQSTHYTILTHLSLQPGNTQLDPRGVYRIYFTGQISVDSLSLFSSTKVRVLAGQWSVFKGVSRNLLHHQWCKTFLYAHQGNTHRDLYSLSQETKSFIFIEKIWSERLKELQTKPPKTVRSAVYETSCGSLWELECVCISASHSSAPDALCLRFSFLMKSGCLQSYWSVT